MKKVLFMALIAGFLLSCSKEEVTDTGNIKGESTVTLSIIQGTSTKGVSDQKENTEYAVIGSGKLYFIDGSGTSIYQRELTATEITALANTSTTAGNKTVVISGVPNTATSLYFMANIKTAAATTYPMVDGTTSADARLRIDKLQANATNVPMSGLSGTFVGSGNAYTASVTLTPIVARVEVGQITCQNQNGPGSPAITSDITGYKLSGVFINYTRESVLLNGTPYLVGSPIDIRSQSGYGTSWATYFTSANTSFPYYIGGNPAGPTDWVPNALATYCTPAAAGLTFYPDPTNGSTNTDPGVTPKKAWGYQVCPSTVPASGATTFDVPHIILKLTEITYDDNPLGKTTQYVTVTKYTDGTNPVTQFEKGNVYRINNLIFTHNESTNQPYEQNITVTATVSVAPWVVKNINPDWN